MTIYVSDVCIVILTGRHLYYVSHWCGNFNQIYSLKQVFVLFSVSWPLQAS